MRNHLYTFLFCMWILILIGGGFLVIVIGPLELHGFGDSDMIISSTIQAIVSLTLVSIWIIILTKMKNWIFRKDMQF